ncbi:biotin carboxyl carrier protein [Rhodovastum atsumiense]|uniref:Biotin carboxyl carrier protein of acetyl-CoA carboxylase n=1 Tax=Rhodovastum atsumiense TaxID=504468 RepID=A0A5M6IVU4_9PROT|nr:acetyl-CoA carboxylase biotin carboxyl carrier protein [Rhodovastum atsumiense]KAA5612436.1 acetyl-CoA carboxylase biotin carboxyl carrier protein [Rhodovastum atsumiense]CAH2600343.1 biotin carboxyl carrier protein [Rhodovastum atsumiense]
MNAVSIDPETVRQLALILTETGLTEIEIEGKDGRVRVARAHPPAAPAPVSTVPVAAPVTVAPPVATAGPSANPAPPADESQHPGAVLSPMVGVAYLSPEPGSQPFVTAGQTVAAGQTLMLIEAMKTFNQIKAPKAGTVTRILIGSGAPVEYGQPLLILE